MTDFAPRAQATGIGSMPHADTQQAMRVMFQNFSTLPYWPQLPRRDFRENMYAQFSEDLVGIQLDTAQELLSVIINDDTMAQVEKFYARYLEENSDLFAVSPDYAAGLYALCQSHTALKNAQWIKGQVTGPISFGLKVVDQNLKPMLYDDSLRDVLVKHLARKAQWHEKFISQLGTPITFVDEPSLALIGASVVALNRDEVIRDLEEVFSSIQGLKGTHCCGNTDWSLLMATSVNIISFDALNYAENLALFAGIVPTVEEDIFNATADELVTRLETAMNLLVKKGIDRDLLYERALITPACGLGTVSVQAAECAFALTHEVSEKVREQRGFS
ncbi:MAG: methionine synthase [Chloroflexi bacterium]|nr:methionine synthase [Chloroflexota bacterium]